MIRAGTADTPAWSRRSRSAAERVEDLLGRMTLEEKVAQLTSVWTGSSPRDPKLAPIRGELAESPPPLTELIRYGLVRLPLVQRDAARSRYRSWPASRCGVPV